MYGKHLLPEKFVNMINIASIYYFSLLQEFSTEYKSSLNRVLRKISRYLQEEGIEYSLKKKTIWEYEILSYSLPEVWGIHLFHRSKKKEEFYYYPSFFSDIYIEKHLLQDSQSIKKVIFFLSNIFECFDEFDEKNMMIEFHKDIEETFYHKKEYTLRYDFLNINSMLHVYDEKRISEDISSFIQKHAAIENTHILKDNYPEVYRTLLFFLYNIFALQKNYDSTNEKLREIKDFQEQSGENSHIALSEERLKMNRISIEKVLKLYKDNFENFMNIIMRK